MHFAALVYAYLLWLLPALLALYIYAFARKRQALAAFLDVVLTPRLVHAEPSPAVVQSPMSLGAVGCLVLALMQTAIQEWQEVQRQGRDLMILLDVSRSMLAEDVVPSRLARAKSDITDLLQVLQQEGGHRLGLVVFAGQASLQCPLTLDYAFFLQQLNQAGPHTVTRGGTLIGDAIRKALSAFGPLANNYKDIILITDGEDHDSFPLEAARPLRLSR
jgi:Ca-activated chloride channel family protein